MELLPHFHTTLLRVVKRKGTLLFKHNGSTFRAISAEAFGATNEMATVPIQIFSRPFLLQPLEDTGKKWFVSEHGTHGASQGVFEHNFKTGKDEFRGWNLRAEWFEQGDVLVITGHHSGLDKDGIKALRKD